MDMNKVVAYIQIQIQIQIRYNLKTQQLNYGEIMLSRSLWHTWLVKYKHLQYTPYSDTVHKEEMCASMHTVACQTISQMVRAN